MKAQEYQRMIEALRRECTRLSPSSDQHNLPPMHHGPDIVTDAFEVQIKCNWVNAMDFDHFASSLEPEWEIRKYCQALIPENTPLEWKNRINQIGMKWNKAQFDFVELREDWLGTWHELSIYINDPDVRYYPYWGNANERRFEPRFFLTFRDIYGYLVYETSYSLMEVGPRQPAILFRGACPRTLRYYADTVTIRANMQGWQVHRP